MTSLAQVTALVDAHVRRDPSRFRAVTLQIAAHVAARSERGAEHLRRLVDRQGAVVLPLPIASGLLSSPHDLAALDDMSCTLTASRVRAESNASDQAARGTWGTEPRPSSATACSSTCAPLQSGGICSCARHPTHDLRHMLGSYVVLSDSSCRNGEDSNQDLVFSVCALCKLPFAVGGEGKIHVLLLRRLHVDTCWSTAICWLGQDRSEIAFRRCGNDGHAQVLWDRESFASVLCSVLSNKDDGCVNLAVLSCIVRSAVEENVYSPRLSSCYVGMTA